LAVNIGTAENICINIHGNVTMPVQLKGCKNEVTAACFLPHFTLAGLHYVKVSVNALLMQTPDYYE
jgi:hypothetical protein